LVRLKACSGGEKRRIFCKDLRIIHKLFWRQRRVAEKLGNPMRILWHKRIEKTLNLHSAHRI